MTTRRKAQRGYSFPELLVSVALLSFVVASVGGMLVQSSRTNKVERLRAEAQASARNSVSLIAQRLRTAGWDPLGVGFAPVVPDADPEDGISTVEVFNDLNADGDLDDEGESVLIRHQGSVMEWRSSAAGSLVPLAADVSNDADGDGVPEPLFTVDASSPPRWIRVRVTAESPVPDPRTGTPVRYTVESEIALRGSL